MENKVEYQFIITESMIENATTYLPLARKIGLAQLIAEACIEETEVSVQEIQASSVITLPQRYKENPLKTKLYLAKIFLEDYLHVQVPENFTSVEYDKYFALHPFNQMERLKGSTAKTKVFDILADFKEFKKFVDLEIYNATAARNDGLERLLAGVALLSTPENVEAMVKELQKLQPSKTAANATGKKKTATQKQEELPTPKDQPIKKG